MLHLECLLRKTMSLATGAVFGLVPAISLWRVSLHDVLKDAARASEGGGRMRVRGFLAAVELALAIVLLTGAGLLLKSFWRMNQNPAGFAPENILVMRVSLSGPQYRTRPPQEAYAQELLRRIENAPGVRSAGVEFGTLWTALQMEGEPLASFHAQSPDDQPFAGRRYVSSGYLRALGVGLVQGRWPGESDAKDAIMINESLARSIGGDPIGRRIAGRFGGVIAGVVANFKYWKLDAETLPEVYIPYERWTLLRNIKVVARTDARPMAAAPGIRKLVADIDRTQPVYELQTLEQTLSDSIAPRRFHLFLLGAFAATALLLALVGIYGLIAYSVSQRTHEIGIRMALGARRGDVVGMVVRQGMGIVLGGIVVGLGAAAGLTRLMASLLYDVKPNDLPTFAAVAVTLAATALLAIWGPALKAALIDPIVALRYE